MLNNTIYKIQFIVFYIIYKFLLCFIYIQYVL